MSELKNMVTTFVSTSTEKFARMDQFMEFSMGKCNALEAGQRNQSAILQDLQNQIGGIAHSNNTRVPGTLPGNTIPNPHEPHQQLDAITTGSGKTTSTIPALARQEEPTPAPVLPAEDEEVGIEKEELAPKPQQVVKEHVPQLPFPTRMHKDKLETEFAKFMAMLKQVNISMPFMEALSKMPK
ncbi:unnamed protein product [Linum trigynum]|uniref:Reverse transcriptase domain-containing protein n=1 Tax=Linum trigynum TaxID=586398 RepID=A0AAV2CWQ3_9ROSI